MKQVLKLAVYSLIGAVLALAVLTGIFYLLQNSFYYRPNTPSDSREVVRTPDTAGFPAHENLVLVAPDETNLMAYWIPYVRPNVPKRPRKEHSKDVINLPTVLYLQGTTGNIGHRLPIISRMIKLFPCNVLMLSYRGYGKSEGRPDEDGIKADAEAN